MFALIYAGAVRVVCEYFGTREQAEQSIPLGVRWSAVVPAEVAVGMGF